MDSSWSKVPLALTFRLLQSPYARGDLSCFSSSEKISQKRHTIMKRFKFCQWKILLFHECCCTSIQNHCMYLISTMIHGQILTTVSPQFPNFFFITVVYSQRKSSSHRILLSTAFYFTTTAWKASRVNPAPNNLHVQPEPPKVPISNNDISLLGRCSMYLLLLRVSLINGWS